MHESKLEARQDQVAVARGAQGSRPHHPELGQPLLLPRSLAGVGARDSTARARGIEVQGCYGRSPQPQPRNGKRQLRAAFKEAQADPESAGQAAADAQAAVEAQLALFDGLGLTCTPCCDRGSRSVHAAWEGMAEGTVPRTRLLMQRPSKTTGRASSTRRAVS